MSDQPIIRGYCRTKEEEVALMAHGLPARALFMEGRAAETLEACLATFRGRPGTLVIARDLRVFGGTKRLVAEVMARLERAMIRVQDITHPEDTAVAELVQRASVAISASRFHDDRTRARRHGRAGGHGKGSSAARARSAFAPDWIVDRIVDEAALPWALKTRLLAPHFTESTLRRRYGARAAAKRK